MKTNSLLRTPFEIALSDHSKRDLVITLLLLAIYRAIVSCGSSRRPFITRPVIIDNFAFGWHCGIAISFDFHVTAIIIASFLQ